ncbi:MauE/DoxX family redox-associated membrane protein [Nonomuraea sp. SYSU D8015]|uniref:MauE/DoxX family redox-associated membrane protein n=1 Tax=Nonomuraea sp. SYSU D8015 TaxID=2593644 RepID=UPI0016612977|nr:MauE/DoxX family redox-associated membrane protein [Nonomuraea sp. SYSU D8015]
MNVDVVVMAGAGAQAILILVFLVAALSKIITHRELGQTIARLGPAALARQGTIAVISAELLAVTGLTAFPSATWPRGLIALLALVFAGAGIRALSSGEKIKCGCFGNGAAVLGWRQVLYLPLWLALAAMAEMRPPNWTGEEGLLGLAVALLVLVAWKLRAEWRVWRPLREDRLAIPEPTRPEAEVPAS